MSDSGMLLSKITALRQRLQEVQGLAHEAGSAATSLLDTGPTERVRRLQRLAAEGARYDHCLDGTIRQLGPGEPAEHEPLPRQLTWRARRALGKGRELLDQLRSLADEPLLQRGGDDPLSVGYGEAVTMTETALRMVQALPDAPSAQLRLAEGLELLIGMVSERTEKLVANVRNKRLEQAGIDGLAEWLRQLHAGASPDLAGVIELAEKLLAEAQEGLPLRFHDAAAELPDVSRFTAAHGLTVAQVLARLVRHDPDLRAQPVEPVVAALVHDAGMLSVPAEVLAKAGPLEDDERRLLERHALVGADLLRRLLPDAGWLSEAAGGHHERLDGTGYPGGLLDLQVAPLTRLVSVCDVYAALCSARPYRRALGPRTALTDTLLLGERGFLDRSHTERLLQLSFYPVGSVVELADGAIGVVVATHATRRDVNNPARPVLTLLTDGDRRALATPQPLDLAQCDARSIVRTLPAPERRSVLGARYPEWAL
jgi:HD-GYP domain-containing protein (c-di-GMP phosphodiesterase class II)